MCAVERSAAEVGTRAVELFNSGYNCAESVLLSLREWGGDDKADAVFPRMATPFGGGISRNGLVCGALCGGILAIGLRMGRDAAGQLRDPSYNETDALLQSFSKKFGACDCRSLTGIDFKDPEEVRLKKDEIHGSRCVHFVCFVAECLAERLGK